MERIELIAFDLRDEKIIEQRSFYLELHPDRLRFHIDFDSEEPIDSDDPDLGWKPRDVRSTIIATKESVVGVELMHSDGPPKWGIYISVSGMASDIKFFFQKEIEALNAFRKVEAWLFGAPHAEQ